MNWNKVNTKAKNKNLPNPEQLVLWATTEDSPSADVYYKFVGWLTSDGKYVKSGLKTMKLTDKFWWIEITDPETSSETAVIMDSYNNLMKCPHCGEIIGNTSDWTPNYCYECGKPLSGGNGKAPK